MERTKIEEYRAYLQGQNISDDTIAQQITIVGDFVEFLTTPGQQQTLSTAGKKNVEQFARQLIVEGRNTLENFSWLCGYTHWLRQRQLYVALIELLDCHNALEVLAEKIEAAHGPEVKERIFREALPPLGANEQERCAYTRSLMARLAQEINSEDMRAAWFQVQHGIPAEAWRKSDLADQEKYRQCGDIDKFFDLKRQERNALLTRLHDEDKLWYTVAITDEVLEFAKNDPEMEVGRRAGNTIYISKIPYNAVRYLQTTDPRLKRYYACHCPLVREAILNDQPISPEVCDCSLGHASHSVAGLGLELKGEVLESAVKGDLRCRFVFYLPNAKNSKKLF
jgi:hypothetical protein